MPSLPQTFYVYVLARPNGKPFYVGKGTGKRIFKHDYEARNGCPCHKCNIIRKVWRQGGEVQRYIMLETADEQEAFAYEIELIAMYGLPTLANRTAGGEGPSNPKDSTRAKMRAAKQGREHTPEMRARRMGMGKGRKQSPEWIAKRVAARKANGTSAHTPAARAKMSVAKRAMSDATKELIRQASIAAAKARKAKKEQA